MKRRAGAGPPNQSGVSVSDQQPVFHIEKVYVKDVSLEAPHAPQIFLEPAQPQVEVQLATAATRAADGLYEVVVTVTVTAKAGDKTCSWSRPRRRASSRSATCPTPTSSRCSASPARTSCSPTHAKRSRT